MPYITVSRQYGSGGSDVAERVARALGWRLYDNDVVEAVATRMGVSAAEVRAREERVPSLVERVSAAIALGSPEVMPALGDVAGSSEERLVEVTRHVIEDAVRAGPAVLVGRGAQCMLAERTDALHVYCYAPEEWMVRRVESELGITREAARARVQEINHHRAEYVRRHWNRDWRDVANYDLCVNAARVGLEGAAGLIVTVARAQFG
jgi:cytidylate kinase